MTVASPHTLGNGGTFPAALWQGSVMSQSNSSTMNHNTTSLSSQGTSGVGINMNDGRANIFLQEQQRQQLHLQQMGGGSLQSQFAGVKPPASYVSPSHAHPFLSHHSGDSNRAPYPSHGPIYSHSADWGDRADSILAAAIAVTNGGSSGGLSNNGGGQSGFDILAPDGRLKLNVGTPSATRAQAATGPFTMNNSTPWMGSAPAAGNSAMGGFGMPNNSIHTGGVNMHSTSQDQQPSWNKFSSFSNMGTTNPIGSGMSGPGVYNEMASMMMNNNVSSNNYGGMNQFDLPQQPPFFGQAPHVFNATVSGHKKRRSSSISSTASFNHMGQARESYNDRTHFYQENDLRRGPAMIDGGLMGGTQSAHNNATNTVRADMERIIKRPQKKKRAKTFPDKLMDAMIGHVEEDAAAWLPDGKSFVIVSASRFVDIVLNHVFKEAKYASFVRKLHRWGFVRLTSGTGTDCFHHPLFQRNRRDLAARITCTPRDKDGKIQGVAIGRNDKPPSLAGVEKFIRAKATAAVASSQGLTSAQLNLDNPAPVSIGASELLSHADEDRSHQQNDDTKCQQQIVGRLVSSVNKAVEV